MASALDYAHRHNVIHRDLKPENILLHDGQPLVADFGIALAVSNAGGQRVTQTGLSLGTPQYMSPEQATGDRAIDGRTDVYSLGALTYEMLAGEPPHLGTTAQAIIAKVLTEKPRSIRVARPSVPEHVEDAVDRALEKLAADRWSTAKEFGDALVNEHAAHATSASGAKARGRSAKPGLSNRAQVLLAVGTAIVSVIATKVADRWLDDAPVIRSSRFELALPDSQGITRVTSSWGRLALSRDGSKLVYVGYAGAERTGLYLRTLADPVPRLLDGTLGAASPTWSPGGEWIAFVAEGKVKKLSLAGGAPVPVADSAGGVEWGENNELLFTSNGGISVVSADGGKSRVVAGPDSTVGRSGLYTPSPLPGGTHALVSVVTRNSVGSVGVLDLATGRVTDLGLQGGQPRYDRRGYVLFGRLDGTLSAAPFSARRRAVTGPEIPIVQGVVVFGQSQRSDYALAGDGTLAFVARDARLRTLMVVDRHGAARSISTEKRLFGWPSLSPDGGRVALEIEDPSRGRWDVWVYDISARTLTRLTTGSSGVRPGGWSDDGRHVYFLASPLNLGSSNRVVSQPWDGGEAASPFLDRERIIRFSMGPDHTFMAMAIGVNNRSDIWIAPRDSLNKARPIAATAANESWPRISRNGRYVAYVSDESGIAEVYIRPIPGPGPRLQVSAGGGIEPEWAPNGRGIFYRTAAGLVSVSLTSGPELSVTRRETLFDDSAHRGPDGYQVFPNGNEFLMIGSGPGETSVATVILNWQALLKKQ